MLISNYTQCGRNGDCNMCTGLKYYSGWDGLVWDYYATVKGRVSFMVSPTKPTKKQMRQVRKAARKSVYVNK